MKKKSLHTHFASLLCALCALLFCGCSGDSDDTGSADYPETNADIVAPSPFRLTVVAKKAIDDTTRALAEEGETLSATWGEGDKVAVYDKFMRPLGTLAPITTGSATAKLQGTLTEIPSADAQLTLVFPRSDCDYTTQNGTLATIASNTSYAQAKVTVETADQTGMTTTDANFANQQAIVKFILVDKDNSDAALDAVQLTISTGGGKLVQKYVQTVAPGVTEGRYDKDGRFVINNAEDWKTFCDEVNTTNNKLDAVMAADVDISNTAYKLYKVGYWNRVSYKGTFDGNGHTLTINYNDDRWSNSCAPFVDVSDGCVIKNLRVAGCSATDGYRAAGIVGQVSKGTVTIQNCHVMADIVCRRTTNSQTGGIAGRVGELASNPTNLTITDCSFTGSIKTTNYDGIVGGIVGYCISNSTTTLTRVLFAPSSVMVGATTSTEAHTFCGYNSTNAPTRTYTDCYYTEDVVSNDDPTSTNALTMTAQETATAMGNGWTVVGDVATPSLTSLEIQYPEENYTAGEYAPQYGPISVKPTTSTNVFYVALRNENGTADRYTLTATMPDKVTIGDTDYNVGYERTFSKSGITFENGKFYIVTVKMSQKGYNVVTYTTDGRPDYEKSTYQTWE